MKIDINPVLRQTTPTEKIILEMRGILCLYVVLTHDGNEYSVQFDEKSLSEFCPSRTVSEMLKSWETGFKRQIAEYQKALKTNIHPYWTHTAKVMIDKGKSWERWNGRYEEVPLEMDKSQRVFFQSEIDRLKAKSGPLTFVKITHLVNSKGEELNGLGYTLAVFTKELNNEMDKAGLPMSKYPRKYSYTYYTKEKASVKLFHSGKTPKEIAEGIEKSFEEIWS
jgi:ribosomal protein L31